MRKFGNFLRELFRALKTTVRIPVVLADGAITWAWHMIAGSPAQPDEMEHVAEIPDTAAALAKSAVEDDQRHREREEKMAAIARAQLPRLVKNACGRIDMGGEISGRNFEDNPDAQWIVPWIQCLDDSHRRTIRHMPDDTLLAHLSGRNEQDCLPSYRDFDLEEAKIRIAAAAEEKRTAGWSAVDLFRDALERAVADCIYDLVDHIALWVEAQRAAGIPEDMIDHGTNAI